MMQEGIPLCKPRKEIYAATKKWVEQGNTVKGKVSPSEVSRIRQVLYDKYGLFGSGQSTICRQEQYGPFVENRILVVLKECGVIITDEG